LVLLHEFFMSRMRKLASVSALLLVAACARNATPYVLAPNSVSANEHRANLHGSTVQISEIATPSGASPLILSAGTDGSVYFGASNFLDPGVSLDDNFCYPLRTYPVSGTCPDSGYLYRYSGGAFSEAAAHGPFGQRGPGGAYCPATYPPDGCSLSNSPTAIDAADFGSVMWASVYAYYYYTDIGCCPWSELEYGGIGGTATFPPAPYNANVRLPDGTDITSIVRARDGKMWLGGGGNNGALGSPATLPAPYAGVDISDYLMLTNGPNHHVWGMTHIVSSSSSFSGSVIFEFGASGAALHSYKVSTYISNIAGTARDLWFTDFGRNAIGKINRHGTITEYTVPTANSDLYGITVAGDGAVWFTESGAAKVGRLNPRYGHIREFSLPSSNAIPAGIASTPAGCQTPAIWVGEIWPVNKLAEVTY
jgi:hypothetical protein